ncbi:MAG: hypothetical protein P4L41_18295 [Flavipsychrobacter sp.]|nr:hypothetical protein [Flavipsychrobacter sp.]
MNSLSRKNIVLIALAVALTMTIGRLVKSNFHISYFIVAGTDFVDTTKTLSPVIVQPGQGYDGQFFYRYALNPLNFKKDALGVNVDHPPYRVQRIAYPVLSWLFSFGGIPRMVPWAMVIVNILAFAGIFFYLAQFIVLVGGNMRQGLLPLFLCGLYMSLGRDLSEVVELFFLTGTIYYLFRNNYLLCSIFATCTILTRDTSIIALLPLLGCTFIYGYMRKKKRLQLVFLFLPFIIFAAWKVFIYYNMPSLADTTIGYTSIGAPFKGIVDGFMVNFDLTNTKNKLQFLFWIGYLTWNIFFVGTMLKTIFSRSNNGCDLISILKITYLSWLAFALCFSLNIYTDDWGFVRIFSQWNMIGFLILIASHKKTSKPFNYFSVVMAVLTIVRLVVRV